jgi:MATE family multidrug resistance protein
MTSPESISYGYMLRKSWPIILANAAVPLLGLVDTAVIGNVGSVADLGAIALGALIFSFAYWSFGFLRMGTTGFAAQAVGAGDEEEVRAVLGRSLLLGATLGVLLILLQWPISTLAFSLLSGGEQMESLAQQYFSIRIWGAPATLTNFALMGLLIGLGNSRQLLLVQLVLNGLNILLDVLFAGVLGWGVEGIAFGTVIAEWSALLFAGTLIYRELARRNTDGANFWPISRIVDAAAIRKTLSANADIMIRTLLMIFSFSFFINQSAIYSGVVLAANHILMQLISFAAFFLDGYAFVVEALIGASIGAHNRLHFDLAIRRSTVLAGVSAMILALLIWQFGAYFVALLTDLETVRAAVGNMLSLAAIYVFFSFAAFQLDGIFIGASRTAQMRDAAIVSVGVFLLAWWLLASRYGVNGLWWAMIIYVIARAAALLIYFPALRASVGEE